MTIVLDGSSGVVAPELAGPLNASHLTGSLPAIDGSALTGINGTPVGAVVHFAASVAPSGFIKANGSSLSTTTYAALFAVIGYAFGGSGSSFNLPDLRGEFLRGWDDARGADSGRGFGSYQGDAIRNITGTFGAEGLSRDVGSIVASGALYSAGRGYPAYGGAPYNGSAIIGFDASLQVPTAADNRPRNVALLACIKY